MLESVGGGAELFGALPGAQLSHPCERGSNLVGAAPGQGSAAELEEVEEQGLSGIRLGLSFGTDRLQQALDVGLSPRAGGGAGTRAGGGHLKVAPGVVELLSGDRRLRRALDEHRSLLGQGDQLARRELLTRDVRFQQRPQARISPRMQVGERTPVFDTASPVEPLMNQHGSRA